MTTRWNGILSTVEKAQSQLPPPAACCFIRTSSKFGAQGPFGKDSTGSKMRELRSQTGLVPLFLSCVTLGKLLNLSESQY